MGGGVAVFDPPYILFPIGPVWGLPLFLRRHGKGAETIVSTAAGLSEEDPDQSLRPDGGRVLSVFSLKNTFFSPA